MSYQLFARYVYDCTGTSLDKWVMEEASLKKRPRFTSKDDVFAFINYLLQHPLKEAWDRYQLDLAQHPDLPPSRDVKDSLFDMACRTQHLPPALMVSAIHPGNVHPGNIYNYVDALMAAQKTPLYKDLQTWVQNHPQLFTDDQWNHCINLAFIYMGLKDQHLHLQPSMASKIIPNILQDIERSQGMDQRNHLCTVLQNTISRLLRDSYIKFKKTA